MAAFVCLAVGSGNVDKFKLTLGISHFRQERLGSAKTGDAALPADGVNIFDGLFGVHGDSFLSGRLFFFGNGGPDAHALKDTGTHEQIDDYNVQHQGHGELDAAGGQKVNEAGGEAALAVVDEGQGSALPQDG